MLAVRWLIRHAHGKERHQGSRQVQGGVRRLGQDAQRVGKHADHDLKGGQSHCGDDRGQRGASFLLVRCLLGHVHLNVDMLGYIPPGTLSRIPTRYPASADNVPMTAISSPLRAGWPTVTRAL